MEILADGQHRSPIDFSEDESDLVYHVVCSRQEDGSPPAPLEPGQAWWSTRDDANPRTAFMPERYRVVFQRMSEFSEDLSRPIAQEDVYELLDESVLNSLNRGCREIAALFEKADYLARRYQAW